MKEKILVIVHSVLREIRQEEIQETLNHYHPDIPYDIIVVKPTLSNINSLDRLNYRELAFSQQKIYEEEIAPKIINGDYQFIAYFGLVPVPVAIHLGYLVNDVLKTEIYQFHHANKNWMWDIESDLAKKFKITSIGVPKEEVNAKGDVAMRISTSVNVSQSDTDDIVSDPIKQIDVKLNKCHDDAFTDSEKLNEFGDKFREAIDGVCSFFPKISRIHLFAAVPTGLAFRLGTKINPNIHDEIITYKYKPNRSPKYQEAIIIQERIESYVELTEEHLNLANELRGEWNKVLAEDIYNYIHNLGAKNGQKWYEKLFLKNCPEYLSHHYYWNNLPSLTELNLKNESIAVNVETDVDGFNYNENRDWIFGNHFVLGIAEKIKDIEKRNQAIRLFLFHESLHFGFHKLTSSTASGIGNFPKTIEQLDYQADCWAMLHEFGYAEYKNPKKLHADVRTFFLDMILGAINTMWSFYPQEEVKDIQIRRFNRFTMWFWQYVRIERLKKDDDSLLNRIIEILVEKPTIELSGPEIFSRNQRIFYKLTNPDTTVLEMSLLLDNKIYRFGKTTSLSPERIVDGFRSKNNELVLTQLRSIVDQV